MIRSFLISFAARHFGKQGAAAKQQRARDRKIALHNEMAGRHGITIPWRAS
jgi:hypothetical protein